MALASLALCLHVRGQDAASGSAGLTNWPGFVEARKAFKGFRVESAAEFNRIRDYQQQQLVGGRITHRFTTASGQLIHCVEIASQPAVKRAGLAPDDVRVAPDNPPVEARNLGAGRSVSPAEFGMDGSVDGEGNVRSCPAGSVPIVIPSLEGLCRFRRLEDLFRKYPVNTSVSASSGIVRKESHVAPPGSGDFEPPSGHEYAHAYAFIDNQGEQADFNIWQPAVQQTDEFSLSQLWVVRGTGSSLQTVETGWQVYDDMYGNWQPHLFIYFTTHNYDAGYPGGYNLSGGYFVQTDSSVVIGGVFASVSVLGGAQHDVTLAYFRDQGGSHNWWLKVGDKWVGYYPNSLFSSAGIADKGGRVDYGGEIVNDSVGGVHTTTDMGSGRFPDEGWQYAAFVKRAKYVDGSGTLQDATGLIRTVSDATYYDLALSSSDDVNWGRYFYFGGPGRAVIQNDLCSGATALADNVYYSESTVEATHDSMPCLGTAYKGVWFTFTPSVTGTATVDTCGSDFDTEIEVLSGSCGALTSIGCNDDGSCSPQSSFSFPCAAGTAYRICAGGFLGASGNLKIRGHAVAGDSTAPTISAFSVSPSTVTVGQGFTIGYTVSDSGGSGLKQIALWRANIDGSASDSSWAQVGSAVALSGNGPYSSTFFNTPTPAGSYWYGVHVLDNANHYMDERIAGLGPIGVTATVVQYTISASAGSGGSISPNGSITKNAGEDLAFTAYPNANYVVNQWLVDDGVVQTGGTGYTLPNIQIGHRVQVTFTYSPAQYTIYASAGSGGGIDPSGSITKNAGEDLAFTAYPNANYVVNQWLVDDGVVQTGGTGYTLPNIQTSHSVQVTFTYAPTQYTISATAGSGGTISPSGDFAKSAGSDQTFTAYPNASYMVNQWLVDSGVVQTGGASYTLPNIQAGHSVQVAFTLGVSVTVLGSPSGVSFTVDGTTYTTGQPFTWVSGSSHPISTTSPQSGGTGVQYLWSNWSDGGAMSHTVAPSGGTTYTANFTTQYRLDTGVSPAGGGTVVLSPAGTWFAPGQAVQLTASASSGYAFSSWAGVVSSSGGTASVTMNGYQNVTANFTAISPGYTFITLAGSASSGSQDGVGSAAGFNFETGAASDKAGNVYVADTYNSTIRKISPDGVVTTVAGSAGTPGSANGVGSAARFLWPNGVAVEEGGTVYVADTYNNTIRKITPARSVSTLAGAAGIAGFADGAGGAARFSQPGAVAVDSNGVLYVADGGNNSIRRIMPGGVVGTLAGWTNAGYADGVGTNALLNGPAGVAVDGMGNVFVADTGNNTIRKIATSGVVSTLAGLAGTAGHADGVGTNARFNGPAGIAVDAAGNVFVADTYNYTIRRVASDGTVTTIAGAPGQYGYRDGASTNALFDLSSGIAVDGWGNVYVADTDNNVVRKGWWSGTPPEIVLHSPMASGGQVQLDFTLRTGPGGGFTLQGADQAGGPWVPDATAVITTNVAGVSYSFTTWPGALAQFYRIQSH